MNNKKLNIFLWIIFLNSLSQGCIFYSKNGYETETDGVRFIRLREDIPIGGEILNIKAFPRNSIKLKGLDQSKDFNYFHLKELNSTNIQILLDKSLEDLVDRDIPQNLLKFRLQCNSFNGRVEEASFLTVTAYVEDINDHPPKFLGVPYSINVFESTPIGSTIFSGVSAFDRDKPNTPNSDVQYSLAPQNFAGGPYFALESPHRPYVILKRKLDYDEGIRKFYITIIASDRGTPQKLSNTTAEISVQDSDDLPPKFTEGVYRTKIYEFSPLTGKPIRVPLSFHPPIQAHDQDSLNTSLYYDIISGNERKLFWINPNDGKLFLDKEIDFEEESLPGNKFVLQVEARQVDNELKRTVARVEIEILDLNDNPPEFEVDLYNISIVENLPSGFSVLQVNAMDRDQGENSEFYYQILEEDPVGGFSIDPHSGWLSVRNQSLLDRELRKSIIMQVEAVEKVEPYNNRESDMGKVKVEITLLDSNDNTPEFEMGNLYEFRVNMKAAVGHIVGYVKATDPDEGRNGMIVYELQRPRTSGVIPFKLDAHTGALTVLGPLDVGRIALFVEASDQPINPSERRFSLAVVTVEIIRQSTDMLMDFIGAPYEFWVGSDVEVGTSIGQIRTTVDWDMQGSVMYDLLHSYSEGVPFAVEERSGTITVIRQLDEFNRKLFEFEAVAAHETFMNRHRSDSEQFQLIRRSSKSQQQLTRDGEILEIEEGAVIENHNMLVTNVTIHVVSQEDERGVLMKGTAGDPIEFHVKENAAGALIGQLLYTNKTNTIKTELSKEIVKVNATTYDGIKRKGKTMSSTKFNKNTIKFSEKLKNNQRKHRDTNCETSFFVNVAPTIFYKDYLMDDTISKSLYHNQNRKKRTASGRNSTRNGQWSTPDIFLPTIRSNKLRSTTPAPITQTVPITIVNSALTQSNLVSSNDSAIPKKNIFEPHRGLRFLIANQQDVTDMITITNEGILVTVKGLDREIRDTYRLTVIAEYSKGYISGAGIYQVTVYVDDENDNAPTFNQISYTGMIPENSEIGSDVLLNQPIIVKDLDIGENSEFSLALFGEGSHLFAFEFINDTEKQAGSIMELYNKSINGMEKSFSGLQMMFLEAMSGTSKEPNFAIRFIGPKNLLDREKENFYNLKIVARDKGGLKSEVKLGIYVADINDNSPIFEKIAVFKGIGIEIVEHANDMEVYFVDNVIEDEKLLLRSERFKPILKFETSTPSGFAHHKDRLKDALDRINIGTPRLINATRDGRRQSTHQLSVSKKSKLSRQIRRDQPIPLFSILENIEVGVSVLKVTATDDDYEGNSQVYYEIISENYIPNHMTPRLVHHTTKFFSIDRFTGEIKINRPLLAESEITLNVTARDIGGLADFTTIRFKVVDVNDHQPIFQKSWYTFDLEEGNYMDNVIGKVEAIDEDFGENSIITYSIQSTEKLPFKISPVTGVLSVSGNLDREHISRYEFKVMAADDAPPIDRLYSFAEIEINILDINDNAPEFTGYDEIYQDGQYHGIETSRKLSSFNYYDNIDDNSHSDLIALNDKIPIYKAFLNRNISPGSLVKHVTAIDKDSAGNGNGLVMYVLVQTKLPYMFEIDSREGIITTVSKFTKISKYEHLNLTVIASDLGSPSMSSTALVLVNLQGDDFFEDEEEDHTKQEIDTEKPEGKEMFNHQYYELEVNENNETPMVILQVNTTNPENAYRWSIINENNVLQNNEFKIDSNNGTLWLVKSLDRETKDLYKLKIRAEKVVRGGRNVPNLMYPVTGDRIRDILENEVRILIRVLDENDNEPTFKSNGRPIVAVIPTSSNFGYPVTVVQASDQDIGINAKIHYTLLNEPSRLFAIDSETGRIRVVGHITHESNRVYGFDVKATDRNGADDGKSTISNVFVYILDENRQVRIVLAGHPVDVEVNIDNLTEALSEATNLDVRVRILEPHVGELREPATDVYIYAVDPKTNSVVDMEEFQELMSNIDTANLYPMLPIIELPQLGPPKTFLNTYYTTQYGSLNGMELSVIIVAVLIFACGLLTSIYVGCLRYRRRNRSNCSSHSGLAYSISKTPSSMRTAESKSSNSSTRMDVSFSGRPRLYSDNLSSRISYRDQEREYIDVPLPKSILNPNLNLLDHDLSCLRFNQIRDQSSSQNLMDTSATSLHSSGLDSGLEISREMLDASSTSRQKLQPTTKSIMNDKINNDWLKWNKETQRNCICAEEQKKNLGEDSSDSYEDSLKDLTISRRTSLPKNPDLRRNVRNSYGVQPHGVRHSFSGVRDDLVQASPSLLGRTRFNDVRNSMDDLEERLRNIGITFHEPFILNNSRC